MNYLQWMIVAVAVFMAAMVGVVSAVECSVSWEEDCTISTSFVGPGGTYYWNDTSNNGSVLITGNNVVFDMNGTTLIGNSTGASNPQTRGVELTGTFGNFTLKNGYLQRYRNGFSASGSDGIIIDNMTISEGRNAYVVTSSTSNVTLRNSNISNTHGSVYADTSSDFFIYNNLFQNTTVTFSPNMPWVSNVNIYNNTFNQDPEGSYQLLAYNVSVMNVYDNTFFNVSEEHGSLFLGEAHEVDIYNNVFDLNDRAIHMDDFGTDIEIYGNVFNNTYLNTDAYDTPITQQGERGISYKVWNWTNIKIYNNRFENFGCTGILLRDAWDVEIYGNTFVQDIDFLTAQKSFNCRNEPFTAIFFHQAYKGFVPSGSLVTDNATITSNHSNGNVNVHDNTFSGVNVLLRLQGVKGSVTHDLTDTTWYRTFRNSFSFSGIDEFYISNDYTFMQTLFNTSVSGKGGVLQKGLISTTANSRPVYNFEVEQRKYSFDYVDEFGGARKLEFFSLNNALVSFSNGSSMFHTGNLNVTVADNQSFSVYDNFAYSSVQTDGLWLHQRFNENNGTQTHDLTQTGNDGDITGALWRNDTILTTLVLGTDFNTTTNTFTVINPEYAWSLITATFQFPSFQTSQTGSMLGNITGGVESFFGNATTWFSLLAIVIIVTIIVIVMRQTNKVGEGSL